MNPNIVDSIVNALEEDIISGKLEPGSLLQQESLADRFKVSRQPVRSALEVLGAKGFAQRRPDRSLEVSAFTSKEADEVLGIRKLLEPEAFRQAIPHLTDQDILLAKQAVERFEYESSPEKLAEHDLEFHLALYRPCGNQTLIDLIINLRKSNQRAYQSQPPGSQNRDRCIEIHQEIIEAVSNRDSELAEGLLIQHFDIY